MIIPLRAWTYVLLSCALFLRKSEAADLKVRDIEVPIDRATGDSLLSEGLPRYIFVHIRRSKTDQAALGIWETNFAGLLMTSSPLY